MLSRSRYVAFPLNAIPKDYSRYMYNIDEFYFIYIMVHYGTHKFIHTFTIALLQG